jgi:hypothetical protein
MGCAMAAMAGASGTRSWLAARHLTWLTPRRLRAATAVLFAAATLGSSLVLSGSSVAPHRGAGAEPQHTGAALVRAR